MRIDIVAAQLTAWPAAAAESRDGIWFVVARGGMTDVLPLGVSKSDEWGNEPAPTGRTLHASLEAIRDTAVLDPKQAAETLALLCMDQPVPTLCEAHGLPPQHLQSGPRLCPGARVNGVPALRVSHVTDMATGLDGLRALARHVAMQRRPASGRMTRNAMTWPLLGLDQGFGPLVLREVEQTDHLSPARARQLVSYSLDSAVRLSGLRWGFEWTRHHRIHSVLHCHTNMAAYVADFAQHLTEATTDEYVDRSVVCQVCGDTFLPRRQPGTGASYCPRPECQRERKRRNQRASRERRREATT